jgi:hypothetical protein
MEASCESQVAGWKHCNSGISFLSSPNVDLALGLVVSALSLFFFARTRVRKAQFFGFWGSKQQEIAGKSAGTVICSLYNISAGTGRNHHRRCYVVTKTPMCSSCVLHSVGQITWLYRISDSGLGRKLRALQLGISPLIAFTIRRSSFDMVLPVVPTWYDPH